MLVKVKILGPELTSRDYYLDIDKFIITTNGISQVINGTKKARFNTLLSLFSLKNTWTSENIQDGDYLIYFEDNLNKSLYVFKENLPSNFPLFLLYLNQLEVSDYE